MKAIYFVALLAMVAAILAPASVQAGGCDCGGISMVPDSGKVGTMVVLVITSDAFPIDKDYEVLWSSTAALLQDKAVVLAKGPAPRGSASISHTFVIPEAPAGTRYVRVRNYKTIINLQFFVKPGIKISPASALPGDKVTIVGQGFPAEGRGRLTFDGKPTNVTLVTNEVGSFAVEFAIPDVATGEHQIAVDDEQFSTVVLANVEVLPVTAQSNKAPNPSTNNANGQALAMEHDSHKLPSGDSSHPLSPIPITPVGQTYGFLGAQTISFVWSEVSDPRGITYVLEVADNYDFVPTRPIIRKAELTGSSYTLNITAGEYHWRIKAVDGSGNESEWMRTPYAFRVGFVCCWERIITWSLLLLLVVLVIMTISIFIQRRRGYYY